MARKRIQTRFLAKFTPLTKVARVYKVLQFVKALKQKQVSILHPCRNGAVLELSPNIKITDLMLSLDWRNNQKKLASNGRNISVPAVRKIRASPWI